LRFFYSKGDENETEIAQRGSSQSSRKETIAARTSRVTRQFSFDSLEAATDSQIPLRDDPSHVPKFASPCK
jgi:hypothetical protein